MAPCGPLEDRGPAERASLTRSCTGVNVPVNFISVWKASPSVRRSVSAGPSAADRKAGYVQRATSFLPGTDPAAAPGGQRLARRRSESFLFRGEFLGREACQRYCIGGPKPEHPSSSLCPTPKNEACVG